MFKLVLYIYFSFFSFFFNIKLFLTTRWTLSAGMTAALLYYQGPMISTWLLPTHFQAKYVVALLPFVIRQCYIARVWVACELFIPEYITFNSVLSLGATLPSLRARERKLDQRNDVEKLLDGRHWQSCFSADLYPWYFPFFKYFVINYRKILSAHLFIF